MSKVVQDVINIKITVVIFYIFFVLSLQNPVCILHLRLIARWTSHISLRRLRKARGYHIGQPQAKWHSPTHKACIITLIALLII